MKKLLKNRRNLLLALGAVAWLVFGFNWGPSKKERMTIAELTTDMQTVCIGRYLVDVPKFFERSPKVLAPFNRFMPPDMDFQEAPQMRLALDTRQKQSLEQFQRDMRTMIESKRVLTNLSPGDSGYPEYDKVVYSEQLTDTAFLFRSVNTDRSPTSSREDLGVEIRFWLDDLAVTASAVAYEVGDQAMTAEHLKKFVRSIKLYDPKKPDQPGFCVGPLLIQGRYSREEYESASFRSKKYPDMLIVFDLFTGGSGRSSSLLQRANSPKNLLNVFDIGYSTLRKGKLQVAGMDAQELGVRFSGPDREGNKRIEHKFKLEVDPPTDPNTQQSAIELNLETGLQEARKDDPAEESKELSSSLTDDEVVGLWDAIVKSIRPRPGAF